MATANASTLVAATNRSASSGSASTISLTVAPPSSEPPIVPSSPSTDTPRACAYWTTRDVTATFSSNEACVTRSSRRLPSNRDQLMARHKANHANVVYAPDADTAEKALVAKAAMFDALGVVVHICGDAVLLP